MSIEKAEATIAALEQKRLKVITAGTELQDERANVALAAHTGDAAARKRLDEINSDLAVHSLFYVKGGGWIEGNEFTVTNVNTGASISGSNNSSTGGWLAGAGFEYAFAPNWTAKVEYNFLALSKTSITVPASVGFPASDSISTNNHDILMLTIGFNYLFNWH
jgi:opacity protein-like surface antigen